ncbi:hypothetical protein [Oceanobacter mangrovi]|uniref:hypothetical protein n=1 Tax=Oceanobacter mangrovi TaxID=2862510 RepID=UPI001C8DCCF7|nr:hypothetical protein [Oceanobacter mangrovi]
MAGQGRLSDILRSLNQANEVGFRIREAGFVLEKAELKTLLAELTGAISEAKMELGIMQGHLQDKDAELKAMGELLHAKANLRRRGDGYYKSRDGRLYGQPYCSYCWEGEQKQYHLHNRILKKDVRICPHCKNEYQAQRTPYLDADTLVY